MDGIIGHGNPLVDRYDEPIKNKIKQKVKIFSNNSFNYKGIEHDINDFLFNTKNKLLSMSIALHQDSNTLYVMISYEYVSNT